MEMIEKLLRSEIRDYSKKIKSTITSECRNEQVRTYAPSLRKVQKMPAALCRFSMEKQKT